MRLPNNLKKWQNRKTKPANLDEIPSTYRLGKGHVTFFYDKFKFLQKRFESLVTEMLNRGYKPNFTDSSIFKVNNLFYNDYTPTSDAIQINEQRILERSK